MRKIKAWLLLATAVIMGFGLMMFGACNGGASQLPEKENAVFHLLTEAALKFKSPSSVRVVSGTAVFSSREELEKENPGVTDDWTAADIERGYTLLAFLRLTGANSFGATTTSNYFITYGDDGGLLMLDLSDLGIGDEQCYKANDFDYAAVNAALEAYWEDLL